MNEVIYFFRVKGYNFNDDLITHSRTVMTYPIKTNAEFDKLKYEVGVRCELKPWSVEFQALNRL